MEIRADSKDYRKLKKVKTSLDITITIDEKAEVPIIMFKDEKGELKEFLRGFDAAKNYLKYGFNRIIKKCPLRHRKCIGEKCSLYFVDNSTGDCALIWSLFARRE